MIFGDKNKFAIYCCIDTRWRTETITNGEFFYVVGGRKVGESYLATLSHEIPWMKGMSEDLLKQKFNPTLYNMNKEDAFSFLTKNSYELDDGEFRGKYCISTYGQIDGRQLFYVIRGKLNNCRILYGKY